MSHEARKRAFNALPETCPTVDKIVARIMDDAEDDITTRIKDQVTETFREVLVDAYDEVIELEGKLDEANNERDDWEAKAQDAIAEVTRLTNILEQIR